MLSSIHAQVARKLDRETVDSVSVTVKVNDGTSDISCTFSITINDYNDNVPMFDPQTYSVNLNEYSPKSEFSRESFSYSFI